MTAKPRPAQKASSAGKRKMVALYRKRAKLSTTVAAENYTFLETSVTSGRFASIAEALDQAISRMRRATNRLRLEQATAAYYDSLTPEAQAEEEELGRSLHASARGIDFDREP